MQLLSITWFTVTESFLCQILHELLYILDFSFFLFKMHDLNIQFWTQQPELPK